MLKACLFKSIFTIFTTLNLFLMKIFTSILIVVALVLIVFNITLLDFQKPFEGSSMIAMIGIVAAFCAVFILLIFKMSKKIEDKLKNQ
jgi:hypothetical protein